jgi:hypothetical protein
VQEISRDKQNKSCGSTLDQAENLHVQRLRRHIMQTLTNGSLTLCEIIRLSAGAYPTDVVDAINSLLVTAQVFETNGFFFLPDFSKPPSTEIEVRQQNSTSLGRSDETRVASRPSITTFIDPHPADYDWRYTSSSINELMLRLDPIVARGGRIALFGATTLFPSLAGLSSHVVLFDRSASRLKDVGSMGFQKGLIQHDLFDPIPNAQREYDAIVADPPWYPDFHRAFIFRSTQLLHDDGLLFLSVLPWLTRPSAIIDRADVVYFALRSGFDLAEVVSGILGYESPKFERIALAKKGINCSDWRFGDLFVFRRIGEPDPDLSVVRPVDEPEWEEFRLGKQKIKLRRRAEEGTTRFGFVPAAGTSPIFEGVSRRSPFRSRIDLWTSDNIAFSVEGLEVLRMALRKLENGDNPEIIAKELATARSLSEEDRGALTKLLKELVAGSVS